MKREKLIFTSSVIKMEYLLEGEKVYTIFYNDLVRKNNILYEVYIKNKRLIEYFEKIQSNNYQINKIIDTLYKREESLIESHVLICNTMDNLKKPS